MQLKLTGADYELEIRKENIPRGYAITFMESGSPSFIVQPIFRPDELSTKMMYAVPKQNTPATAMRADRKYRWQHNVRNQFTTRTASRLAIPREHFSVFIQNSSASQGSVTHRDSLLGTSTAASKDKPPISSTALHGMLTARNRSQYIKEHNMLISGSISARTTRKEMLNHLEQQQQQSVRVNSHHYQQSARTNNHRYWQQQKQQPLSSSFRHSIQSSGQPDTVPHLPSNIKRQVVIQLPTL